MLACVRLNLKQTAAWHFHCHFPIPFPVLVFRSLNFKAFRLSSLIDSRTESWQLNHFEMPIQSARALHALKCFTYDMHIHIYIYIQIYTYVHIYAPFWRPQCVIQLANAKLTANKAASAANDEPKLNSMPPPPLSTRPWCFSFGNWLNLICAQSGQQHAFEARKRTRGREWRWGWGKQTCWAYYAYDTQSSSPA